MVADQLAKTEPPAGAPRRGRNALLPLLVLIGGTIGLVFLQGTVALRAEDPAKLELPLLERIPQILNRGESQRALLYAAIAAFVVAILLGVGQRIVSLGDALRSALRAAQSLAFAAVILVLAWSIGSVCEDLGTAQFLSASIVDSFSPWLLPLVMFMTASLVSFCTGTSYGTMAILLPNVVVLAHTMGSTVPELTGVGLMVLTIGAVLEGSIFGDHCSPISDTTVLSSVSTGCDHLHHVKTQAPYALVVMVTVAICGYIPVALFGLAYWPLAWIACFVVLLAWLLLVGRRPDPQAPAVSAPAPRRVL